MRIYRCREQIIDTLDRQLEAAVPKGFTWHPHKGSAFNIGLAFDYPRDLSQLPAFLLPYYIDLISRFHPLLMPLIDLVAAPPAPGERREAVASRGRLPFTPPGVFNRKRVREYTRSIPASWKGPILERHSYLCAICHSDLRETGYHFDHIVAFSKGGDTSAANLQPLCPKCNLQKGNR